MDKLLHQLTKEHCEWLGLRIRVHEGLVLGLVIGSLIGLAIGLLIGLVFMLSVSITARVEG